MKRPEKIVMGMQIKREKTEFVNHLEKPLYKYTIELPSWIGLAYNPHRAKVEIRDKGISFAEARSEGNHEEIETYVKTNWGKKLTTMRKLNNNYMQVFTIARDDSGFVSHEDYKNYRQELAELNEKYLGTSRNNQGVS